jgi:adenylate cyclase
MTTATATPTAVRTAPGAIAFTDLTGFSEFTAIQGDEAALRLIETHERMIRQTVGRRGRIVKNLGDGFLLWFRDACDAVEAGLRLLEAVEEQSMDLDLPMWVRVGIHFGEPLRYRRDIVGHDVNVAARIVDLAAPGEVLVSEACTEHMSQSLPNVMFDEVGPVVMKGIPEAVTLYRALRW